GRPPLAVARCGYGRSRTRDRGAAPPPEGDPMTRARTLTVALILATALTACSGSTDKPDAAPGELVGLFRLTAGAARGDQITGTWFRMVQPDGDDERGPYMVNADSPADGGEVTLLAPGT